MGVDLKMGGNLFQSSFGATKDTQQNFQLQCLKNTQQLYSRTGTKCKIFFNLKPKI